jgi:hypothetical protein
VKRCNLKEADVPSNLNYLNDANWVDIFGTSDANTCVSLFYEKLELFFPVLRSPARLMTHRWYTRELLNLENRKTRTFKYSSRTGNRDLYALSIRIYIMSTVKKNCVNLCFVTCFECRFFTTRVKKHM